MKKDLDTVSCIEYATENVYTFFNCSINEFLVENDLRDKTFICSTLAYQYLILIDIIDR